MRPIPSVVLQTLKDNPITFFAYEWVNPRFGKKIKEVNLHGTVNYQATANRLWETCYKTHEKQCNSVSRNK